MGQELFVKPMSFEQPLPHDAIASFIEYSPDPFGFFGGKKIVFDMLHRLNLLNLVCPKNHELNLRKDCVQASRMGYCEKCKQNRSVLTNTFFFEASNQGHRRVLAGSLSLLCPRTAVFEQQNHQHEGKDGHQVHECYPPSLFKEDRNDEGPRVEDRREGDYCGN